MASLDPAAPASPPTILLVDDEEGIRQAVAEALEMIGYAVVQAATAEEALTVAQRRGDLSLVVTDVRLPGMSGVDLADHLARIAPRLRTILISGFFAPQAVASRLISKPFTVRELDVAIRRELDGGSDFNDRATRP